MKNATSKVWLALFFLYIVWGTTYLNIQYLVGNIPPIFASGIRNFLAGIILFVLAIVTTKFEFPNLKTWIWSGLAGILMLSVGNGFLTVAVQWVPSGYASLFPAIIPVWLVILQWIFDKKSPSYRILLGCLSGIIGVGLLVNLSSFALKGYEQYFALGVLFLIIATLSWSFGVMVAIKKAPSANVVVVASVQMIVGGAVSLMASGLMGEYAEIDTSKFDSQLITAFAYLLFVASVAGFLVFNWVSREASPTLVATYNYVNPLVAISLGVFLNNESVNTQFIFAAIAIIVAVILITTDKNKG